MGDGPAPPPPRLLNELLLIRVLTPPRQLSHRSLARKLTALISTALGQLLQLLLSLLYDSAGLNADAMADMCIIISRASSYLQSCDLPTNADS